MPLLHGGKPVVADEPTIKRLATVQLEAAAESLRRAINDPLQPSRFARLMLPKIEAELEARRG
jgi:hypothetical protein